MVSPSSTDVNSELVAERCQPSLECSDDARRDAGGMPVHAHHGAKGLKPEGIGQPPQQLVASVVADNGLRHHGAKARHPIGEPTWNVPPVQRQIGVASPSCHPFSIPVGFPNQGMFMLVLWSG